MWISVVSGSQPGYDSGTMLAPALDPSVTASPFLKWAGGKGQLLPWLEPFFPRGFRRYIEPFLGGGAVFFHVQPRQAILGDANPELINCYQVVRDSVEDLIEHLHGHRYEREYFYEVRAQDTRELEPLERASRFIFLNKTCYNGLYRENRQGQFNVPFGKYARPPRIVNPANLRAASHLLRPHDLLCASFEETVDHARAGDFIYLDPPYLPVSATANFTQYIRHAFRDADQQWLAQAVRTLSERGCLVLLNNSDSPRVRWLYEGFRISEAQAPRAINCDPAKRQPVVELIITNY